MHHPTDRIAYTTAFATPFVVHWLEREMVRAFAYCAMDRRMDALSYFSSLPVLNDWCNKGRGMCYPVCGMMHIKEPLLLYVWSFTILMSDAI